MTSTYLNINLDSLRRYKILSPPLNNLTSRDFLQGRKPVAWDENMRVRTNQIWWNVLATEGFMNQLTGICSERKICENQVEKGWRSRYELHSYWLGLATTFHQVGLVENLMFCTTDFLSCEKSLEVRLFRGGIVLDVAWSAWVQKIRLTAFVNFQ